MIKYGVPLASLADKAREVMPEGMVLLKNENCTLPLLKEDKVAVFGRCQIDLYRSGTGSGGSVNVPYVTNLIDGLLGNNVNIDNELLSIYKDWIKENPYDNGGGTWASDPWNQKEFVISVDLCKKFAKDNNKAIIVIGRTAGEDKDYSNSEGSYLLTNDEKELINNVCSTFDNVVLLFNVSNIIDMSFVNNIKSIKSIMYVWQGGMVGGLAIGDVLSGKVSPSGKLPDTIASSISKYPSDKYFYDKSDLYYVEDIYVGYRYFNTFDTKSILYPFGFGLTYTTFEISIVETIHLNDKVSFKVLVKNVGKYAAKEVIQVYLNAPNGLLGRAKYELLAYNKTSLLQPNEEELLEFIFNIDEFKTYDDSGKTGYPNSYVLEKGTYNLFVGNSSMDLSKVVFDNEIILKENKLVSKCHKAGGPTKEFNRFIRNNENDLNFEAVPLYDVDLKDRIKNDLPNEIPYTGYKGIKLLDVKNGKYSLEEFISQLDDENLTRIIRGEGMCNPKVTPGVAACFGGVTEELTLDYGVPPCATSDGPSGIRMDVGFKATQIPIGTLIASTWNDKVVEELFYYEGLEIKQNKIDSLLGPGINIHRHPLNGRNFEYMSEDPVLTGKIAAAEIRGLYKANVLATIKHMCCNNKETNRYYTDSIVSERALREIYLKAFEICVKEANVKSIMTSYNLINGYYGQNTYDILTTILRNEWNYDGMVMTDWWALNNDVIEKGPATQYNLCSMIRAQNDLYMVVDNYGSEVNINNDNLLSGLNDGLITRSELQRSVKNILNFILECNAMNNEEINTGIKSVNPNHDSKGKHYDAGRYTIYAELIMHGKPTAQGCTNLYLNDEYVCSAISNGTNGKTIRKKIGRLDLLDGYYDMTFNETKKGVEILNIEFIKD